MKLHPEMSVAKEKLVELLLQAGTLARALSQEVQAGTADFAAAFHHNLVDARAAQQEGAFHTNAIAGHTADGETGVVAVVMHVQNNALELLNTFAVAFFDFHMHGY